MGNLTQEGKKKKKVNKYTKDKGTTANNFGYLEMSPTVFINRSIIVVTSNIKRAPRSPTKVCSTEELRRRRIVKEQNVHIINGGKNNDIRQI